uniref:Uncharacterized protein n=1 Tax=Cebus imitator TaxID=2715852 RepID=A0A2K5PW61_CEBIM
MGAESVCTMAPEFTQDELLPSLCLNPQGSIGIKGCDEFKNLYLPTSNKTTVKKQNACLTHPDRSAMAGLLL